MGWNRKAGVAAGVMTAVALAVGGGIGSAVAQSEQRDAAEPVNPSPPPGFIVTPPRGMPKPQIQEFHYRLEPEAAPEQAPSQNGPQSGGCRYEERKLDLLV